MEILKLMVIDMKYCKLFFLFTVFSSFGFADNVFNAVVIVEQQSSNRNNIDWSSQEAQLIQLNPKIKNPNELLYYKNIGNICSTCYFFDKAQFNTELNAGIVDYNVYPINESNNYQINAYIAVARCGEFYINQQYDLKTNKLFQYKVNCGNNPDKSIITTISFN